MHNSHRVFVLQHLERDRTGDRRIWSSKLGERVKKKSESVIIFGNSCNIATLPLDVKEEVCITYEDVVFGGSRFKPWV
jgi:hypothetical protein